MDGNVYQRTKTAKNQCKNAKVVTDFQVDAGEKGGQKEDQNCLKGRIQVGLGRGKGG